MIIADSVFSVHSWRLECCDTNKKIPKIINFTDPKFFKLLKISGVSLIMVNKHLFKDGFITA